MPRQPDPNLEQRILDVASRLWSRGGEKALTMRAVAKAAGTTKPTVYERYQDREDILRALRLKTRRELFAALRPMRSLRRTVRCYLDFAHTHSHAYQVLFDEVAKPPSLHEGWPSFNLIRERLAQSAGGDPREHTRTMLAVWGLMHGTAMLIIRGGFNESLRAQAHHACLDAVDAIADAVRAKRFPQGGPKWPANLIIGEGRLSRTDNGNGNAIAGKKPSRRGMR